MEFWMDKSLFLIWWLIIILSHLNGIFGTYPVFRHIRMRYLGLQSQLPSSSQVTSWKHPSLPVENGVPPRLMIRYSWMFIPTFETHHRYMDIGHQKWYHVLFFSIIDALNPMALLSGRIWAAAWWAVPARLRALRRWWKQGSTSRWTIAAGTGGAGLVALVAGECWDPRPKNHWVMVYFWRIFSWNCCLPPPVAPPPDCKVAPKINSRLLSFLVPVWRRALKTRRANNHKHVVLILDGY